MLSVWPKMATLELRITNSVCAVLHCTGCSHGKLGELFEATQFSFIIDLSRLQSSDESKLHIRHCVVAGHDMLNH